MCGGMHGIGKGQRKGERRVNQGCASDAVMLKVAPDLAPKYQGIDRIPAPDMKRSMCMCNGETDRGYSEWLGKEY